MSRTAETAEKNEMTEGTKKGRTKERTIAVIVPVYNGEQYLKQCADSILGQTYSDLELWLIDDGSEDGSPALCDAYAEADSRVHVVHKQNEGLMRTWMRGVTESRAPYLCFVDCDDWIDLNMLEILTGLLAPEEEHKKQIACCGYRIEREWNGTHQDMNSVLPAGIYEGQELEGKLKKRILGCEQRTLILSRCMKLFSRELFEDNMHYCVPQIRMGEDVNITVPVILDADRVAVAAGANCYHYRYVQASMVHAYDSGMYDNIRLLRDTLSGIMRDKRPEDGRQQVEREYLYLFLLELKNEIRRSGVSGTEVSDRIRTICRAENSAKLMNSAGDSLHDPANRLLAMIMKYPVRPVIAAVRAVFLIRDGRQN